MIKKVVVVTHHNLSMDFGEMSLFISEICPAGYWKAWHLRCYGLTSVGQYSIANHDVLNEMFMIIASNE